MFSFDITTVEHTRSMAQVPSSNTRLERAQQSSMQTLQQVQKALEKRFSGLVQENTALRQVVTSSTLQNRELIQVQQQETGSLQEQLEATQAELARVKEERAAEKQDLHQQIDALRAELKSTRELALSKEQEVEHTMTSLKEELKQARQETLQRIAAFQIEKEAAIQEVRASVLQQIALVRSDERSLANQDAEKRITILKAEHTQEIDVTVKKAIEDGKFELYRMFWRVDKDVVRHMRQYFCRGMLDPVLAQRVMQAERTGQL